MRRILSAVICVWTITCASAQAQDRWPERIWFGGSGGVQTGGRGLDQDFEVPLYAETERIRVEYPAKSGGVFDARGGFRLWKRVTVGAGVTRFSRRADARVEAQVPHPFFDNQFRQVEGTTSALRGETAAHLLIGWMQPLADRFRVMVTAGPSFLNVEQTLVTDVQVSEAYPYDTAQFTGATTRRVSRSAAGFHAGADLTWMISRRAGVGALVQFTRARARLPASDNRRISVDAGGVQGTAGIRLFF